MDVASKDRLEEDIPNTNREMQTGDAALDALRGIRLPKQRGGHQIAVVGNPEDYIIIYGGTTIQKLVD